MAEKRTINIDINSNASEAEKDFKSFNKAVDETTKSAKNLDATFEEVYGDLQPLTTRMGEAEDRLYELALAGDTASKEYQELLTKVGEYRKVQIQTDLAVDGAATTMTQKLGSALNGATSGFAATQGAMALFGDENQALEESLLKVQSALAIQQGVQGLTEAYRELSIGTKLAGAAQYVYTTAVGTSTGAMKLFRLALIGTGIGAIVVGIGLLIANFDKVKKAVSNAINSFDKLGPVMKYILFPITAIVEGFKLMKKGLEAFGILETDEEKERQKRAKAEEDRAVANANRLQKEIDNLKEIRENIDKNTQAYQRQLNAEIQALEQSKEGLKNKQKIAEIDEQIRHKNIEGIEEEYNAFKETQQLKLEEYEKEISKNQARIDAAKARGSSAYKTELFYVEKYTAEANKLRNELNTNNFTQYQEYINKLEALDIEKAKKEKEDQKASNDRYKQYLQDRLSIARQIEDIENGLLEDGIEKELEINRDKFRRLREDAKKNTKLTRKERARLIELFDEQELAQQKVIDAKYEKIRQDKIDKEKAELQELVDFNEELRLKEIEDNKAKNLQIIEDNKAAAAKQKEIDEKAAQEKADRQNAAIDLAVQGFQLIAGIAEAFAGEDEKRQKKAFQIKKVADIASATVDGYRAVLSTYAQTPGGPVLKGIAAGLAGSFAALQIANIAKQQFQGGGDGADVAVSADAGGGEAAVPQFNVVGDSGINQLAQLQQQPTQAYVVSGEVTTSQALDRNRVQNATL